MREESVEYILEYTEQFIEDVETHKKAGQKSILSKINSLIDEIQHHPTTGTGKPEALRGDRKGQWSRRITGEHRLIYEIHEDIITIVMISAAGHYGDK
jgi:toxin YoeB